MNIDFSDPTDDSIEAEDLLRVLHYLPLTSSAEKLRGEIIRQAFDHIRVLPDRESRIRRLTETGTRGLVGRILALWRGIKGPSHAELELSKQRYEALDRADRAERSSFEALAEMVTVGRERDKLREKLGVVQLRIKQLEDEIPK